MGTAAPDLVSRPARRAGNAGGFGRRATVLSLGSLGVLVGYLILTAHGGPVPAASNRLSRGAVVLNSAMLVFREGLEAILVLAAVMAGFVGESRSRRRPVAAGALLSLLGMALTWVLIAGVLGAIGAPARYIEAATGVLAVLVLLVVMNWFFHKVYWTGWIAHHHRRRRELAAVGGGALTLGLVALGFTAVYREGFETVLFLQTLRLKYGAAPVLDGVLLGSAGTFAIGAVTFVAERKLPYKRMLVITGALIGVVLVVMVGQTAQDLQEAGWLPTTSLGVHFPGWVGTWFALYPTVATLSAQTLAVLAVVGSYLVAEELRVRRPARRQAGAAQDIGPIGTPAIGRPTIGVPTPASTLQADVLDPSRLIGLDLD